MPAYHQMGHDSRNLLDAVTGYAGAIISPVNEVEVDVAEMVREAPSPDFEFVFDPQLYFPRRSDRGKLASWSYFPQDFDTADMSSESWWKGILDDLAETAARVGARVVCSPATIPSSTVTTYTDDYYEAMRAHAEHLAPRAADRGLRAFQTVIVRLADLAGPTRALDIASVVSETNTSGIYLVMSSEGKPRAELRDQEHLKGAMKLIRLLEDTGLPVLVACSSSDILLWKTAGATSCATGKFMNLRRFTEGRFNEGEEGGRQFAYWFEEKLLAFLRATDIPRVQQQGFATKTANPFGAAILEQLAAAPTEPWVGLGWRQYMHWFADVEHRLASHAVTARDLVRDAEKNWQTLEDNDVFMEEPTNDGSWLRPWLRAIVEFNK